MFPAPPRLIRIPATQITSLRCEYFVLQTCDELRVLHPSGPTYASRAYPDSTINSTVPVAISVDLKVPNGETKTNIREEVEHYGE